MKQNWIALAMAALMALAPAAAFAAEGGPYEHIVQGGAVYTALDEAEEPFAAPMYMTYYGQVLDVRTEDGVTFFTMEVNGEEYECTATDRTPAADNAAQELISIDKIEKGDYIKVWALPMVMMSLPARANAKAILWSEKDDIRYAAPFYTCGSFENGYLTDAEPSMVLRITEETELVFADARGIIRPRTDYFAWAEGPVAESYPAQGTAGKVIVLESPVTTLSEDAKGNLIVGDVNVGLPVHSENGILYVPFFKLVQELGYTTRWLKSEQRARLLNVQGEEILRLYAGELEFTWLGEKHEFDYEPIMVNGRLYVETNGAAGLLGLLGAEFAEE